MPRKAIFKYEWRHLQGVSVTSDKVREPVSIKVGKAVWVEPQGRVSLISQWERSIVISVKSQNILSVTGILKHILSIR